jgi:creatinine amidohydrolase
MAAEYAATKVAEKADAVLAPLITVGTSEWHKKFPGMIGLSRDTLLDYLRQYCQCLARNGFDHIFFISPHVFNDDSVATLALEMREQGVTIGLVNLWHVTAGIAAAKKVNLKESKFTHAGEIMTSVMMAIAPETVKMDKAVAEAASLPVPGAPMVAWSKYKFQDVDYSIYRFSNEETKSGSLGDPMAATPEKGKVIIDGFVESTVAFLKEFVKVK